MKKAFTLVEILIVAAILGILAAIVLPEFRSHAQQAKEAAARESLRILRTTIERYAAEHNGISPGYPGGDPSTTPNFLPFRRQLTVVEHYLPKIPENPFNNLVTLMVLPNGASFPAAPFYTSLYGWIYKPQTKTIKLNWPGTDSKGVRYFDY